MSRHSRRWSIASIAAATGIVVAGAVAGLGAGTEPAKAGGTDGQQCTSSQVTATMISESAPVTRQSRSYAVIKVTAKPEEACHIDGAPPATLQGAGAHVLSDNGAPQRVLVTPSAPAWIPVDWADEASPSAQETPRTITLDLPGATDSPDLEVPWTGGGIDVVMKEHPVAVRSVQSGAPGFAVRR